MLFNCIRKRFIQIVFSCMSLGVLACPLHAEPDKASQTIQEMIQRAGNADEDAARLGILRTLVLHPELDEALKQDVDRLIAEIDRWIDGVPMTYFSSQLLKTKDYDFKISEDSPVYPLTRLYHGRMILRLMFGYGGYWGTPEKRAPLHAKARESLERYTEAFPENRIARMYLGEMIPSPKQYESVAGCPQWAADQREGLERLTDIITWWIDHRMRSDGQYGGHWSDDCEMWRWWVAVLIGFDDPKITAAQARFSLALMSQKHMQGGYTTHVYDVEHTAEDSADVLTPMMHLEPDNPQWQAQALRLAELMETFWTGRNERGFLQFKSTYFGVDKIDPSPQRACDTVYHPRTVQPALLYWQRTGDPKLGKLFTDWMDTWVDATARAERGKPAGVIPSAIHWPDGHVGGLGERWWAPENHGESKLYYWPSAMSMMTNSLLLTYHMTGDEIYLEPIRSMVKVRLDYLRDRTKKTVPGSAAWCGAKLTRLGDVAAKYKLLTGSDEFDELLSEDPSPYVSLLLNGEREPLIASLQENVEALRINFEGYTSEVRFTDRVLRTPMLFQEKLNFAKPDRPVYSPDPYALYSSVTGDPGSPGYFPFNAVRWLTTPRDIAALVTKTGRDHFEAELFHFGESAREMAAELFLLDPGKYRLSLNCGNATDYVQASAFEVTNRRTRIELRLPPRQLCTLRVWHEQ